MNEADVEHALAALQNEGFVMQGAYTGRDAREWCERRLLARIHRYTVARLRRDIEPVRPEQFMRFLLRWQRLTEDSQGEGADALLAVIEQLEGFEAPLASWERDLLPQRIKGYTPSLLDELGVAGRVQWMRLTPPRSAAEVDGRTPARATLPVRTTPIAHVLRSNVRRWQSMAATAGGEQARVSSSAQVIVDALDCHGALFFDELVAASGMLRTQTEDSLGELVAAGRVVSDHFNGLRWLLLPAKRRAALSGSLRRRAGSSLSVEAAGRWSLAQRTVPQTESAEADLELAASVLLRRYGVVFRRLLEREPRWMPPWRELVRVYRRLEARGEIRGGRFVTGFAGEQFALAEAVPMLRDVRHRPAGVDDVTVSAADCANLLGVIGAGQRIPATSSARLVFREGVCVGLQEGGRYTVTEMKPPLLSLPRSGRGSHGPAWRAAGSLSTG